MHVSTCPPSVNAQIVRFILKNPDAGDIVRSNVYEERGNPSQKRSARGREAATVGGYVGGAPPRGEGRPRWVVGGCYPRQGAALTAGRRPPWVGRGGSSSRWGARRLYRARANTDSAIPPIPERFLQNAPNRKNPLKNTHDFAIPAIPTFFRKYEFPYRMLAISCAVMFTKKGETPAKKEVLAAGRRPRWVGT